MSKNEQIISDDQQYSDGENIKYNQNKLQIVGININGDELFELVINTKNLHSQIEEIFLESLEHEQYPHVTFEMIKSYINNQKQNKSEEQPENIDNDEITDIIHGIIYNLRSLNLSGNVHVFGNEDDEMFIVGINLKKKVSIKTINQYNERLIKIFNELKWNIKDEEINLFSRYKYC